ncbi:hypothetical protein MTO96_021758 [Rhipicephalus appendiculatus]
MPPHTVVFSDPQVPEVIVAPVLPTPYGPQRIVARVLLPILKTLSPTLPRASGLQPPMELAEHPCDDLYSTPMPTRLPTMVVPVRERSVFPSLFSAFRNVEREATSDEQLASLAEPLLRPQLPLSRGTLRSGPSL